jgi:hypothetical protein
VRSLKRQIGSLYFERSGLSRDKKKLAAFGLLLCAQKDHALVEYALAAMNNRLFVSKYQLVLPSKEDLQRFLERQRRELVDQ